MDKPSEEIAAHNVNQDLIRIRQPNVLPLSASWRFYLGNLGFTGEFRL